MATNRNYGIGLGAYLDTTTIEKQIKDLENKKRNIKFTTDDKPLKDTTKSVKDLDGALKNQDQTMQDNLLTFQAANMLLSKTIDIMSSMVEQVYELNGAVTEYRKVTDLSGASLDNYVDKLGVMGREVARTS